jgi:uncharacterized OB-fold protein
MADIETSAHPAMNPENRPFWQGAAQGKLLIKHCLACDSSHFYPRVKCPFCRSGNTIWKEAAGKGQVYSYTVMRRAAPPLCVAYVTLEEGPTIFTNLVDCDLDRLAIGQIVEVTFRSGEDGLTRPVFRPT